MFKDNSADMLREFEERLKMATTAIGMEAERFAKSDGNMPVDTGRARNSITFATKEKQGGTYSYSDNNGKGYAYNVGSGADKGEVYVGSSVEYFPYIENGSRYISARHVLKNAASNHTDKYKSIMGDAFRGFKY